MGTANLAAYAAKLSRGTATPFRVGADPTSGAGGTLADRAIVGSLLVNTTNGRVFSCTAVGGGSVTWQLVGA
jgi:hypothetical protein